AWIAADVEPLEAASWNTLLTDHASGAAPNPLTLAEAIEWATHGLKASEDDDLFFGRFRVRGITPRWAGDLVDLGEQLGADPLDVAERLEDYRQHGIPDDDETLSRWAM